MFNPNLYLEEHMHGKIDRRKSIAISPPRVEDFEKNRDRCLVVLRHDEVLDNRRSAELLHHYYEIVPMNSRRTSSKHLTPSAADQGVQGAGLTVS